MLGNLDQSVTAGIIFKSNTKELESAANTLSRLQRSLRDVGTSSVAMSRALDDASSSTGRLGTSAGGTSGSLSALQAQMVATAGASKAFENNVGDLEGALNSMTSAEYNQAIKGLHQSFRELSENDLREMGLGEFKQDVDEFKSILQDLPEQEFEEFARFGMSGGRSGNIQQFVERTEGDVEAIKRAQHSLQSIEEMAGGDAILQAMNEHGSAAQHYADMLDNVDNIDTSAVSFLDSDDDEQSLGHFPFELLEESASIQDIITGSDETIEDLVRPEYAETFFEETSPAEIRKEATKRLSEGIQDDAFFDTFIGDEENPIGELIESFKWDEDAGEYVYETGGQTLTSDDPIELGVHSILGEAEDQAGRDGATLGDALALDDEVIEGIFGDILEASDTFDADQFDAEQIRGLVVDRATTDEFFPSPNEIGPEDDFDYTPLEQTPEEIFGPGLQALDEGGTLDLDTDISQYLDDYGIDSVQDFFEMHSAELQSFLHDSPLSESFDNMADFQRTMLEDLAGQGIIPQDPDQIGESLAFTDIFDAVGEDAFIDAVGIPGRTGSGPGPDDWEHLEAEFYEIAEMMDESDVIANAITQSDDISQAINQLSDTDPAKMQRLVDWTNNNIDDVQQMFNNLGGVDAPAGDLPDDLGESSEMISNALSGNILMPSDDEDTVAENVDLSPFQSEMLARMSGNIDQMFMGESGSSSDMPITYEGLFMGIQQEMLDADSIDSSRYQEAEELLTMLEAGQLTQTGYLSTDEGQQTIESVLRDRLPDDANNILPEGFDSDADVASLVAGSMADMEEEQGPSLLFDMLSPDTTTTASDPVGQALGDVDLGDRGSVQQISKLIEDDLPAIQQQLGAELGPGLTMTSAFDDDMNLQEMLPPEEVQNFMLGEGSGAAASEFTSSMDSYTSGLRDQMSELRSTQQQARVLTGLGIGDIPILRRAQEGVHGPGMPNRRRGLFGSALRPLTRAMSGSGMSEPRQTRALINTMTALNGAYNDMLPLLEATSVRLGSINVNFESLGIMIFKITGMLGPLISALGGLVAGLLTVGAALGGIIGAGAIDFFTEMRDTMAGVEDRSEAMAEMMENVKLMALEALQPLRNADIGGEDGMGLFVSTIRGGLVLLNRFAEVMSTVLEANEFETLIDGLHNFAFDRSGDDELAQNLQDAANTIIPLLMDIASAIFGGIGESIEFATWAADVLGSRLLGALEDIVPVLALITVYGVGFINMMIWAASVVAKVVNFLTALIDAFLWLLNVIPGVEIETRQLIFAMGGAIGALNVFVRVVSYTVGRVGTLIAVLNGTVKALAFLNTKLAITTGIVNYLNVSLGVLIARLSAVLILATLIYEALAVWVDGLDPILLSTDTWQSKLASIVILLSSTAMIVAKIATGMTYAAVAGKALSAALLGVKLAIGGILIVVGAITLKLLAIIGIIVGVLYVIAEITSYLLTGEGLLTDWESHFETIADYVDRINDGLDFGNGLPSFATSISGGFNLGAMGMLSDVIGLDTGGFIKSNGLAMLHAGEQVLSENEVDRSARGGGGGDVNINVRMENNGAIGMRDMDRWIEQKFDELMRQTGRAEF